MRGILPLDAFHVPGGCAGRCAGDRSRCAPTPPSGRSCWPCAEPAPDRPSTWINAQILELLRGAAPARPGPFVECWLSDRAGRRHLVGGLSASRWAVPSSAESMFRPGHRRQQGGALPPRRAADRGWLRARLDDPGFTTEHLARFGGVRDAPRRVLQEPPGNAALGLLPAAFRTRDRLCRGGRGHPARAHLPGPWGWPIRGLALFTPMRHGGTLMPHCERGRPYDDGPDRGVPRLRHPLHARLDPRGRLSPDSGRSATPAAPTLRLSPDVPHGHRLPMTTRRRDLEST